MQVQIAKKQIMRQQLIMKHLGFYKGRIDGIWSRSCIDAKRQFEFSKLFAPAYPNRGLPLELEKRLPDGVIIDPKNRQLLTHIDFDEDTIQKLMGNEVKSIENAAVPRTEKDAQEKRERLAVSAEGQASEKKVPDSPQEQSKQQLSQQNQNNRNNKQRHHKR